MNIDNLMAGKWSGQNRISWTGSATPVIGNKVNSGQETSEIVHCSHDLASFPVSTIPSIFCTLEKLIFQHAKKAQWKWRLGVMN